MEEIWKDVKEHEGIYQASNLGRIRSNQRQVKRGDYYLTINEKIMTPVISQNGYLTVSLSKQNKKIRFLIHRLVFDAFIGINSGLEVNHINGDKKDNSLINLELISHKENIIHAFKTGLSKSFGQTHNMAKISEQDAINIKYNLNHLKLQEIANIYNVRESLISRIKNGKRWKHI